MSMLGLGFKSEPFVMNRVRRKEQSKSCGMKIAVHHKREDDDGSEGGEGLEWGPHTN